MGLCPIFLPEASLHHDPGPGHPEASGRLRAIRERVSQLDPTALHGAEPAAVTLVERVHPARYIAALANVAEAGGGRLDPDTVMSPGSYAAGLGAVGATIAAVRSAFRGKPAFAAVRPPGHHALLDRPMGFCLFGNVVVGAREAQALGAPRILVVDWDVHHGNGTQALVEHDPAIRFISLHQSPHWPYSGAVDERGVGNVFNVPMPAGLPPARYVEALWSAVLAATADWQPDAVLVSAGFDSMRGDPLGDFTLEPEHYVEWTRRLREWFPELPLAMVLEGGYDPARLAAGVVAVAGALA